MGCPVSKYIGPWAIYNILKISVKPNINIYSKIKYREEKMIAIRGGPVK